MEEFLISQAVSHPWIATAFMVIGVARTINKPMFALFHKFAEATPSKKDDEVLQKVEGSKIYSYICFLLDYSLSIKIGPQAPKPEAK